MRLRAEARSHSHYKCPKATLTFWEGLELPAVLQVELLQVSELSSTCKTIAESANNTVRSGPKPEAFSQQCHKHSKHASSLTLRQRCQRTAAFEVERLERCAVLDTCMSHGQNQSHRIL